MTKHGSVSPEEKEEFSAVFEIITHSSLSNSLVSGLQIIYVLGWLGGVVVKASDL